MRGVSSQIRIHMEIIFDGPLMEAEKNGSISVNGQFWLYSIVVMMNTIDHSGPGRT